MTADGVDSADAEPKTKSASVSGWHVIGTPVSVLTKAIYDTEFTAFRAAPYIDGLTADQEIAAIIARKQASSNIDADILACVAGQKVPSAPESFEYSELG